MVWMMAMVLVAMWILAMLSSYSFGGYVHVLLFGALGVVVYRFASGRPARRL